MSRSDGGIARVARVLRVLALLFSLWLGLSTIAHDLGVGHVDRDDCPHCTAVVTGRRERLCNDSDAKQQELAGGRGPDPRLAYFAPMPHGAVSPTTPTVDVAEDVPPSVERPRPCSAGLMPVALLRLSAPRAPPSA